MVTLVQFDRFIASKCTGTLGQTDVGDKLQMNPEVWKMEFIVSRVLSDEMRTLLKPHECRLLACYSLSLL
jgi:hypothetical protein